MFFSVDKRLSQTKDSTTQFNDLTESLKTSFKLVREEFDEHLSAINENTSEQVIQNNHLCEMDQRLTKIEERMDEIHHMLQNIINKADFKVELTKDEQRVFLLLYTSDNFISPKEAATKLMIPLGLAENALEALMDKAIPVEREMIEGKIYFRMRKDFKLRQAKEQIVAIDPDVTQQYQNALLKQFFDVE